MKEVLVTHVEKPDLVWVQARASEESEMILEQVT